MDAEFYEGRRLSYGGALCTVRFVGEVAGTKGKWLGVEWDDPTRGKHAGEHNGVKYFQCASKHLTAGSFVRPDRPLDQSLSFKEAIKHKYASDLVDQAGSNSATTEAVRISGKEVKEIGFEKVKRQLANLYELRIVILDGLCVARPGARAASLAGGYGSFALDSTDVEETAPKIVDLDLSRNLFEQWDEIFDIIRQLHRLTSLKFDGNRFRVTLSSRLDAQKLPSIKQLSLNDTLLLWQDICGLPHFFPLVESLSLNQNEYSVLNTAPQLLSLTSLDLERNQFTSLEDVISLAALPKLKRLNLKGNRISSAHREPQSTPTKSLAFSDVLEDVDLSYNQISDWTFINQLNEIVPGMNTLRVSHNPLYESLKAVDGRQLTADDGYMLTFARLGRLTRLNFSNISEKERLNAETYYLSQIVGELAKHPESEEAQVLIQHPRYRELSEIYGKREINRNDKAVKVENSLSSRLLSCTFEPDEAVLKAAGKPAVGLKSESFTLELPKSFSIYNALGSIGRHLKIKPMLLKLVWLTGEEDRTYTSDDGEEADDAESRKKIRYREEIMVPKIRSMGTWIDGATARIRIEMSEEDVGRNASAHDT